jgi:hypothetical protein
LGDIPAGEVMSDEAAILAAESLKNAVVEELKRVGYWVGKQRGTGEDLVATHESALAPNAILTANVKGVHLTVGRGSSGRLVDPIFTPPVVFDEAKGRFRGNTKDGRTALEVIRDAIAKALGPPKGV